MEKENGAGGRNGRFGTFDPEGNAMRGGNGSSLHPIWEEEFDGSYGDLFTGTDSCKGCKNSYDGDIRHRRHCIVDIKDFIRNLFISREAAAYKEGVKDGETRTKNGVGRYQMGCADGQEDATQRAIEVAEGMKITEKKMLSSPNVDFRMCDAYNDALTDLITQLRGMV